MHGANLQTIPSGVDGQAVLQILQQRVLGADGPAAGSAEANEPYLRSEQTLVRFLIARQWDVEKATTLLREHYKWLAETQMEVLLKDPFPEEAHIKMFYPQAYHGTDKKGRPIYIERPGSIDMRKLLQKTTPERILHYMYAGCERHIRRRLPACSLARGEVVDKSLNIMDLQGLGFGLVTHNTARKVLRDVVQVLQNHYPECSGQMVIINAPKVFSIAWSFVKPMLDEKTVSKITIFGSDKKAYGEFLLALAASDQLPSFCGGSCICDKANPLSCMQTAKGPWTNPEILEMLDVHPLEHIMTPEGARLLLEKRARAAETSKKQSIDKARSSPLPAEASSRPNGQSLDKACIEPDVGLKSPHLAVSAPLPSVSEAASECSTSTPASQTTENAPQARSVNHGSVAASAEVVASNVVGKSPDSTGGGSLQVVEEKTLLVVEPGSTMHFASGNSQDKSEDIEKAKFSLPGDMTTLSEGDVVTPLEASPSAGYADPKDAGDSPPKLHSTENARTSKPLQIAAKDASVSDASPATTVASSGPRAVDAKEALGDHDLPARFVSCQTTPTVADDDLVKRGTPHVKNITDGDSFMSCRDIPMPRSEVATMPLVPQDGRAKEAQVSASSSALPAKIREVSVDQRGMEQVPQPSGQDVALEEKSSLEARDPAVFFSIASPSFDSLVASGADLPDPAVFFSIASPYLDGGLVANGATMPVTAEMLEDIREAELEVSLLREECDQHEKMHMQSLETWVVECNAMVHAIGRGVIERAQAYYDCEALSRQAAAEYAELNWKVGMLSCEIEKSSVNLSTAEAALEQFMLGEGDLSEDEWNRLAPLPTESDLLDVAASNAKLTRTLRVVALSDCVAKLQAQREEAVATCAAKGTEVDDCAASFTAARNKHSKWKWNSSIKLAEPFYRKRYEHEDTVCAQLSMMEVMERRLQVAMQHVDALRKPVAGCEAGSATEGETGLMSHERSVPMSLNGFEIAGAGPQEDEYASGCSNASDEEPEEF